MKEFMDIMNCANYNFETSGTKSYVIFGRLTDIFSDILTQEQLEQWKNEILPPEAYDDNRNRKPEEYKNLIQKIGNTIENKNNYNKGMQAA